MFVITVAGCYKKCYCLSKYTAVVCLKSLEVVGDICSGNFNVSTNIYFVIFSLTIICFNANRTSNYSFKNFCWLQGFETLRSFFSALMKLIKQSD